MKTERTRVLDVRKGGDDGFWAQEVERAEAVLEATFPARVDAWSKGARGIENFADTVAKVRETVTSNGGSLEYAWQTAGIYDFVAVLNFPSVEAEFRSRNEVYKLGTITADHVPAIPLEEALKLNT